MAKTHAHKIARKHTHTHTGSHAHNANKKNKKMYAMLVVVQSKVLALSGDWDSSEEDCCNSDLRDCFTVLAHYLIIGFLDGGLVRVLGDPQHTVVVSLVVWG